MLTASPLDKTVTIIAFCGKEGVGKSTAARHLAKTAGYTLLNFSDTIKKMTQPLGYPMAVLEPQTPEARKTREEHVNAITSKTGREMLLLLGRVLRAECHDNIFVNCLLERLEPENKYVIGDLRYPAEFEALARFNTLFVEVRDTDFDLNPESPRPIYADNFEQALRQGHAVFIKNEKNNDFLSAVTATAAGH